MPRSGLIYLSLSFVAALVAVMIAGCVSDAGATSASAFQGYTSWTKMNKQPITGDATGVLGSAHEGARGFREVFINDVGKNAGSGGSYSQGTLIVKESYKKASSGGKGDLTGLTIMVKREAGYDPENGDWEYLNATSALKIRAQGKLGGCINCHAAAFDSDYVFTKMQ